MDVCRTVFIGLCCCLLISACRPKVKQWFVKMEDITFVEKKKKPQKYNGRQKGCNAPLVYAPDPENLEHAPMRYIRVNMHFMNHSDSTKNFNEAAAVTFAKKYLNAAEHDLKKMRKLAIPPNNQIPALPKQYKYVLTPLPDDPTDVGVYCHYDDDLYFFVNKGRNRNNSKKEVINKYAVKSRNWTCFGLKPCVGL